ncbi:MAG: hypothetical protein ACYTAF_10195 [Planctomycetota bacterium]|jgi:hypothetical protein
MAAPHSGSRVIVLLSIAVLIGLIWAVVETGLAPGIVDQYSEMSENEPGPPAKPPPGAGKYELKDMQGLFDDLKKLLAEGRILGAQSRIAPYKRSRVPREIIDEFIRYQSRIRSYLDLLSETYPGTTIDVPDMWAILIRDGGRLVVKNLTEREDGYSFETLIGVRSRVEKDRADNVRKLPEDESVHEITEELRELCGRRKVRMNREAGGGYAFTSGSRKKAEGHVFFDLADFCARNGLNARLPELFDAGLERDTSLVQTVHEMKANRMIDVFLYFLSIKERTYADSTHDFLKKRYKDTHAYQNRIDWEVREAYKALFKEDLRMARTTTPPQIRDPDWKPPWREKKQQEDPAPKPEPKGEPPKNGGETGADTPPKKDTPAVPKTMKTMSQKTKKIWQEGDKFYEEAKKHILNSDPNVNPDGYNDEIMKAIKLLSKARDNYVTAQELCEQEGAKIPTALMIQLREAMMDLWMCRKRAVSLR